MAFQPSFAVSATRRLVILYSYLNRIAFCKEYARETLKRD
jgi:hypothetical protein